MQPTIIMILSDNKRLLYSINTPSGDKTFEAEIKEFAGNKYYEHKGIKYKLPAQFNGKKPVIKF